MASYEKSILEFGIFIALITFSVACSYCFGEIGKKDTKRLFQLRVPGKVGPKKRWTVRRHVVFGFKPRLNALSWLLDSYK